MKEFIEKLIERLEEHCGIKSEVCDCNGVCSECDFKASIEIVKELAEECKGGWIPCGEKLPKENIQVIVTAEKGGHRYTTDAYFYNGKFYNKHYYKIPVGELNDSSVGDNVLAWMPLPAPYKEGE